MQSRKSPKKDLVVHLLQEYPELTVKEVAERAGCNRAAIYKMPEARNVISERQAERACRREAWEASLPRGVQTTDEDDFEPMPTQDCWDELQKQPLDILIEMEEEGCFDW